MPEDDYVAGKPTLNGTANLVAISGCSGGGKSSLLAEMARRGFATMPEPGRQIVKEQLSIGGDALPWGDVPQFVQLCVERAIYFYTTARPAGKSVLFDRSLVDAVAALRRLGLPVLRPLHDALLRYRYASVVFITPPWQELFAADAERRHSFADAVAEYEDLLRAYPSAGYEVELIPRLGLAERGDFLERRLARLRTGSAMPPPRTDGHIRLAKPDDHAAVADCVNAAFGTFTLQIGKPPAPMLADYAALIGQRRVHLLEIDGAVVGALVSEPRPDHLFVDVVAVRPEAQRQGLGRRLMRFAEAEAARRGLAEVRLYTHEVMAGAQALYRTLGYRETARRVEDGYARIHFARRLPAP